MTSEYTFFLYLLECYANFKNRKTSDVLREWEDKKLIDEIYDGYWGYHTEAIENAYVDIDSLLATGKHAF